MRFKKYTSKKKSADINSPAAQAILKVAKECFLEKGYREVTFREIASRAEVTSGLIPYYFASKEKLAGIVCTHLMDELAGQINGTDFGSLGSGEKFYVNLFLEWKLIDESPEYARFYYSFNENTLGMFWGNGIAYKQMVQDIIDEYQLDVEESQNEIYQIANRGATRELLLQRYYHRSNITREDLMDITNSNYFYNLGLSDEHIYRIIENSKDFLYRNFPEKMKDFNSIEHI